MTAVCPFCGGKVVSRCRCWMSHQTCENDHEWHHHGGVPYTGAEKTHIDEHDDCKPVAINLTSQITEVANLPPGLYILGRVEEE